MVTPSTFKSEVIAGYKASRAYEVLHKAEMLDRPKGRDAWTVNGGKSIGQVYRMHLYKVMPDEEEEGG